MVVKHAPDRQWAGALAVRAEALTRTVGICSSSARLLLGEQRAVDAQHRWHVMARLGEGRNAVAVALHRILAGVVGSQGQLEIVTITCQQIAQVMHARPDVLFW